MLESVVIAMEKRFWNGFACWSDSEPGRSEHSQCPCHGSHCYSYHYSSCCGKMSGCCVDQLGRKPACVRRLSCRGGGSLGRSQRTRQTSFGGGGGDVDVDGTGASGTCRGWTLVSASAAAAAVGMKGKKGWWWKSCCRLGSVQRSWGCCLKGKETSRTSRATRTTGLSTGRMVG